MRGLLRALVLIALPGGAMAGACSTTSLEGTGYTVCRAEAGTDALGLYWADETGAPYGQFTRLDSALRSAGREIVFAMNAGMYHPDRSPVGHYREDGETLRGVVESAGPGNFGMLPNGILCLRPNRFDVVETLRYAAAAPACRDATQSGPMLVIDGALHPRFIPGSPSRFVRNGVGTTDDGQTAYFAISDRPVNFHDFARFFRDGLGVNQALYLDGKVSRLYAPGLNRSDAGWPIGPIVALTRPVAQ